MGKINESWYTSTTDEWATPQKVFDELDAEFGFTLDPCCTDENAKCGKHYTLKDNGLEKSWGGGDCFRESSFQPDEGVGKEMLRGVAETGHQGCDVDPCKDRYKLLPRLHIPQSGAAFHPWQAALQ